MPADIRIVKYTGEYGPNIEGLVKNPKPKEKAHNFSVQILTKAAVAPYWGFKNRPNYVLLEPTFGIVNIGDEAMRLGNAFLPESRDYYQSVPNAGPWHVIIRNVFFYSWDGGSAVELKAVLLWDSVPANPDKPGPKVESSFGNIALSSLYGAVLVEPAFAPIDITELPKGHHLLSLMAACPNTPPRTVDVELVINKADIRLAPKWTP